MALLTTTRVWINKKEIPYFESLELEQELSTHHRLTLQCRASDIPTTHTSVDELLGKFKEYIGTSITVEIAPTREEKGMRPFQFMGVVVNIDDHWQNKGRGGLITIYAASGTIMAEGGSHYTSFYKQSLAFIVNETLKGYHRNALDVEVNPMHPQLTDEILYSVQDGCSDFQYLKRLAAYYGQWLYSVNGKTLHFGTPKTEETLLEYGKSLKDIRLEMRPSPHQFTYLTDDYLEESGQHQKDSNEAQTSKEPTQQFLYQKSTELFSKTYTHYHDSLSHDNPKPRSVLASRFDRQLDTLTKAKTLNQVVLIGTSDNPALRLGHVVRIKGQGRYRILKIRHANTHDGNYTNSFEAIESSTEICPKMDLEQTPKASNQVAKVYDNADPERLGRLQVQFPWQVATGKHTPWIRMTTAHAGLDRGVYCLPEIGDEVVVDFHSNYAERPYVVGTLYNGTQKPDSEWASQTNVADNNIKALRTRSGHTIILDDTDGAEFIKIHDNEGSIISFDTQAKSLSIHATENIEIAAKNIAIKAEEDITIQAQGNITKAAQGDIAIQSQGTTDVRATGNASVKSNAAVALEATSTATLKGAIAKVNGQATVEIKGTQTKVTGSAMAEVTGGIVKVN